VKQLKFFDVAKEDWEFLKTYDWARKEHLKWIVLYEECLKIKIEYLGALIEIKERLVVNKIIDFDDAITCKKVTDSLDEIEEKLNWIPNRIDDIKTWIEFNQDRASKIN
tara:strand:- start:695 stop:1021 length:327 start_codon:yes stop_codon:yes gene_type:complete